MLTVKAKIPRQGIENSGRISILTDSSERSHSALSQNPLVPYPDGDPYLVKILD